MTTESEQCVDSLIRSSNEIEHLLLQFDNCSSGNNEELIKKSQKLLQETQAYVNNNRSLIPSYILMKINSSLQNLERRVREPNKSKLNFKFKSPASEHVKQSLNDGHKSSQIEESDKDDFTGIQSKFLGVKDKDGGAFEFYEQDVEAKDVRLLDLKNCSVVIIGLANTVYMRNLQNVTVTVLLACRSITMTNCRDCVFKLACQQLRIDSARECIFQVFTSARTMLESSKGLVFKELKLDDFSNVKNIINQAKFEKTQNQWKSIDDFDWLNPDRPSENYKLIE